MHLDQSNLHYHPLWNEFEFSKEHYSAALSTIANKKEDQVYATDGQTIYLVGKVSAAFQQFKGILGFENQTDVTKINYALLKFLRYGGEHHYFTDEQIKRSLEKLKSNLQSSPISREVKVFSSQISYLKYDLAANHYINKYYEIHISKLQDARWTIIYRRAVFPFSQQTASYFYNLGKISHSQGNFSEAIKYYEKSLEIVPKKFEVMLKLAKSYLAYSETLSKTDPMVLNQSFDEKLLAIQQYIKEKLGKDIQLSDIKNINNIPELNETMTEERFQEFQQYLDNTSWNTYRRDMSNAWSEQMDASRNLQKKALDLLSRAWELKTDKNASNDILTVLLPLYVKPPCEEIRLMFDALHGSIAKNSEVVLTITN